MLNLADWVFGRSAAPPAHDDSWYHPGGSYYGGSAAGDATYSGIPVSPERALYVTAVHACVRLLSLVGYLPLRAYQRKGERRERMEGHPVEEVLRRPNDAMSSCEFRETMTTTMLLRGNAIAEVVTDARQQPVELWPLPGRAVTMVYAANGKELYYDVKRADGTTDRLTQDRVLHLRDQSLDGLVGMSRVALAKQAVGLALATESHGARHFGQGARPQMAITFPGKLTDTQYERFKEQFENLYGGPYNTGSKTAILEHGAKADQLQITNEAAQYLETRGFQLEEIARLFGVPLFLLMHHEKSTSWGTGLEQTSIGFTVYSLGPIMIRWEQAIDRDLLLPTDHARGVYLRHNADALVRGDLKTRAEFYEKGIQNEWLSPNEARAKEEMNPRDGGDEYRNPSRVDPAGSEREREGD